MGQGPSKGTFPQSRYYQVLDYGYCKVWKRKDSRKQTMEEYEVSMGEGELAQYQKMWQLRTQQDDVVGVYYFNSHPSQEICSLVQTASILTERIPYRLSQLCNIPYAEVIALLRTCFKAYKILYAEYGLFRVRSTMLGINCQRQLKVWHHTDLATPQPENSNCSTLLEMLQSIIQAVQTSAEEPFGFVRFSYFLEVNRERVNVSFDEMLKVLETYRRMNKITECQALPQLSSYLRQVEGWQESSLNSHFLANLSHLAQQHPSGLPRDYALYEREHRGSPGLTQSHKTVKRSPSMNIYTHRDVNRILQGEKQHQQYFRFRNQRLNMHQNVPLNVYEAKYSPPKLAAHHSPQNYHSPHSHSQQLKPVPRCYNSLQGRQYALGRDNRVSKQEVGARVQPQERMAQKIGMSSIERRLYDIESNIYQQPEGRFKGEKARPIFGHEKRGRLEISSVRTNSLSNSKSKESSYIYI